MVDVSKRSGSTRRPSLRASATGAGSIREMSRSHASRLAVRLFASESRSYLRECTRYHGGWGGRQEGSVTKELSKQKKMIERQESRVSE